MPYPAKTSPQAILAVALDQFERHGEARLSMRAIAAALHLAPNALYRYYADRETLLATIAEEGRRALLAALEDAVQGRAEADRVLALAAAYLDFARARPALYRAVGSRRVLPEGQGAHEQLWAFVVQALQPLAGESLAPDAAVALLGYLHGMVGLEQANLWSAAKPRTGVSFGLNALLRGIAEQAAHRG